MNAQKDQFNTQDITNLLWAMAKLVDNGQEQITGLKATIATLLPHVNAQKDQFIPQHIAKPAVGHGETGGLRAGADTRAQKGRGCTVAPREGTEKPI